MNAMNNLEATREFFRNVHVPCVSCGYDLCGVGGGVCPECGWRIDVSRYLGEPKDQRTPADPDGPRAGRGSEPMTAKDWLWAGPVLAGLVAWLVINLVR
ncbi:MAG: hypothetical protein IPJ41_16810 [Phycisphaerales bacterium]|nr:hypothetical protein [Phycisphaerales bacterium]